MGVSIRIAGDFDPRAFDQASARLDALHRQAVKNSDTIAGAYMRTSDSITKFGKEVTTAGEKTTAVGKKLTTGVTLPLLGVGAIAFKTAADFETAMNLVAAATGAPAYQMAELDALAMKMGADTIYSASEAAGAMLELAKSGITPAQIEAGALAASLDLAAAGNLGLEQAATTTANALNMFRLKAEQSGEVADALAGGANASSASVDSLTQSLAQVGPGATNAGMSLQETVGVLAAFADRGIQGSDAGTSLKVMLQRLIPTTDEAAAAMEKYDLTFVDAKGNFDAITTVAEKLRKKLGGLSEAERAAALQTIFGSDATRAATVLMQQGEKGLAGYIAATNDKAAAEDMAKARTEGAAGAIEQMRGSVETAAISLGQGLAPMVVEASQYVKELADRFAALDPLEQEQIIKWGLMAAAVGPVVIVVGQFVTALGTIITISGPVIGALHAIGVAAWSSLGPVGLLVGVIMGLTAWLGYLTNASDPAAQGLDALLGPAKRAADGLSEVERAARDAKAAQDALAGENLTYQQAELNHAQALLRHKEAQDRVREAEEEYGKNSPHYQAALLAAQQANIDLERATGNLSAADKKLFDQFWATVAAEDAKKQATENLKNPMLELQKRTDNLRSSEEKATPETWDLARSLGGVAGQAWNAAAGMDAARIAVGKMKKAFGGFTPSPIKKPGESAEGAYWTTGPELRVIGEGGYKELVLTSDPAYEDTNLAAWWEYGRMMDVTLPTAQPAGRSVVIMPGAVQIAPVFGGSSSMSEREMLAALQTMVDEAFDELGRELARE